MKIWNGAFIVLGFVAGLAGGFFAGRYQLEKSMEPVSSVENGGKQIRQIGSYKYINPLLECDIAEGTIDATKKSFNNELDVFVAEAKVNHDLTNVAVYYRDLNNGPTFGVGPNEKFFPASLLKVPIMMAFYHWSEVKPDLFDSSIPYEQPKDLGFQQTIIPREQMIVGQTYTVRELLERMIRYSDNQALFLLSSHLPLDMLENLFKTIGVDDSVLHDSEAKLTVKEYSGFFRMLFNGSYLSREHSEDALALLASTDYDDALPAGVPLGTVVAHKFGEAGTGETERQLHDCGIVYFPDHPYLVCIMTRGHDTDSLRQAIAEISGFIYGKIDEQY